MSYPVSRAPGPALSPSLPPALAAMAAELVAMRREIAAIKRGMRAAQLSNSSVEAGTITFNDSSGNAQLLLGLQQDGTHALVGVSPDSPNIPSDPEADADVNALNVSWDGYMSDGSLPTADFAWVNVYADPFSLFGGIPTTGLGGSATIQGQMTATGSLNVSALTPGVPYVVQMTAVNISGGESDPGDPQIVAPSGVIDNISPGAITGTLIAAGTITADLIAGGTVIAGIIDGTTINGAQFTGVGGRGEVLMYSAAPASGGALTYSISTVNGADAYGNAYLAGVMSYQKGDGTFIPSGNWVAQGWQNGQMAFATATSAAGPYTVASGSLRGIFGALQTGYSVGQDVNGNNDPPVATQLDARTIAMGGRVLTTGAWTNSSVITNISGGPFILPPNYPAANVPDIPIVNGTGGATGNIQLHPNGNLILNSTQIGTGYTVCLAGTFRW